MGKMYVVHGVHDTVVEVPAKDDQGNSVKGMARSLIVELVPVNHHGGSIREVIRLSDEATVKSAREMFEIGGVVEHLGWRKAKTAAEHKADLAAKKAEKKAVGAKP